MKITRLKELMKEKGVSQIELAEAVEVARQTIWKWQMGLSEPKQSDLQKIASVLGVTVSELLEETPRGVGESNVGQIMQIKPLPVLKLNACAGAGLCTLEDDYEIAEQCLVPINANYEAKTHFCIRVNGSSMSPRLDDEDYAIILKPEYCDGNLKQGDIALICYCGDYYIRYVETTTPLTFSPQNPRYKPIIITPESEPYTLVGKVVGKIKYEKIRSIYG